MLTVKTVADPIYANEAATMIDCMVKFVEFPDFLPFTASEYDTEEHGRELYRQLIAGIYGPIAPYVSPPKPAPISAPVVI